MQWALTFWEEVSSLKDFIWEIYIQLLTCERQPSFYRITEPQWQFFPPYPDRSMKDGLAIEVKHRKNSRVSRAARARTETASALELIWNSRINHFFGNFLARPDNFTKSLFWLTSSKKKKTCTETSNFLVLTQLRDKVMGTHTSSHTPSQSSKIVEKNDSCVATLL